MPDSGIMSQSMSPPPQQPPFYSPPAPPPPHSNHNQYFAHHGGGGGMMNSNVDEDTHTSYLNYNGDSNGNINSSSNGGGGHYSQQGGGGGGGVRSVSFINSNNPNDPNNNQRGEGGGMMMMLEDDGGGGGRGPPPPTNGGDMMYHHHHQQHHQNQRDLFEEIRNGGGHWSQLLRQVVLTSPIPQNSTNNTEDSGGGGEGGGGDGRDDPMTGDNNGGGGGGDSAINGENNNRENETDGGSGGEGGRNTNSSHTVPLQIVGGSENGQFVYVGITNQDINRWITVGYLQPGDIILEIQGQQVAGYTQADVISLLHHCLRGNSATLTVAPRGSLGPELRSYLNTRFQKGSVDHALQGVVRDNLYLRTVPVTTRTPRPGEINGVDYTFLSVEQFMQLERDGSLLESGVYAGNHYGTPKPWARLTRGGGGQGGSEGDMMDMGGGDGGMMMTMGIMEGGGNGGGGGGGGSGGGKGPILPGMHPSSEGKRRRNRSNVEALGAGGGEDEGGSGGGGMEPPMHSPSGGGPGGRVGQGGVELGPLPANWEMAYTDNGEVYFIDHNTGTSHWLDPRLSRVQKMSLEECTEDELPFGWERIEDPHYGVYYIDHVNRRTQFENPVIQAKQQQGPGDGDDGGGGGGKMINPTDRNGNGGMSTDSEADSTSKFLPVHQDPPPPPPAHHHQFSYDNLANTSQNQQMPHHLQYLPKRPTSLSKPVPPAPNPKPQNPNRLSISQQQRTKTPVNEMDSPSHGHVDNNMLAPAFPSSSSAGSSGGGLRVKPVHHGHGHQPSYRFFTRDPSQLIGERITTTLVKSSRGLGFTIVGGDDDDGLDEFLQIKSVVAEGPACIDGKLRTGDVLVKVNGTCVLGYTHQEMVSIFQSIAPGEDVELEVCRGYPLPFDPADPNTEIVTTVAVAPLDGNGGDQQHHQHHHQRKKHVDWATGGGGRGSPDSLTHSAHSLPELSNDRLVDYGKPGSGRPASVDLLLDSPKSPGGGGSSGGGGARYGGSIIINHSHHLNQFHPQKELVTTVSIVKGNQGFGFTIADSVTGQKVKKVLDASHCGGLEEGDRLIAIDGIDLRGLSHTQVVQILKDFPIGREASLTIQRSPPNSPYGGVHNQQKMFGGYPMDRVIPTRPPGISPRSKTPTAELARGRPRIRDNLPERPKTPNMLDSSGGRGEYNGLFNGDVPQLNSPLFGHQFLERLGGGNGSGGNNVGAGENSPGGQMMGGGTNGGNGDLNIGVRDWLEMKIDLQRRQEGFGFRIVGGTEEGSQVSVGHIVPGGAAALDGRLNTGDQLIAVEGCSVVGASHHSVVQLMARSASQGKVRLTVRRPVYSGNSSTGVPSDSTQVVVTPIHSPGGGGLGGGGGGGSLAGGSISSSLIAPPSGSQSAQLPLHVTLRRRENEGFGFVIISSASKAGATIGRIVEGSPADRCGELHVGDRILAVNQLDISQLHHSDVVQLIKDSGFALTLSVLPVNGGLPTTPTTPTTIPMTSAGSGGGGGGGGLSMPQFHPQMQYHQQSMLQMQHSSISPAQEMENLSLKDGGRGEMGTAFISPEGQPIHFSSNHSASSSYPDSHEPQVFSVHLSRGNRGFGFSIRGGKEFQNMPLFVLRLAEDGPAAIDGRMQVGDQILQINGIITHGMTHAQAIHLIKTGGASVHLLLRRGSVPFPFLNQMPNLTSSGFSGSGSNGQELEEQSLSNASNTNEQQQFLSQNAAAMYRDHSHMHHPHAGF